MLDHIYGSPSNTWKRVEAIIVALLIFKHLSRYSTAVPVNGSWMLKLNSWLGKYQPCQVFGGALLSAFLMSKFSLFAFLNSPEPYAGRYNRNYYRATWVMAALDAGFLSALPIKNKKLQDFFSVIFTVFYLFNANLADYKLRRLRNQPTLEMLRHSWEKKNHPIFSALEWFSSPEIQFKGRKLKIPRNPETSYGYNKDDERTKWCTVYLYCACPSEEALKSIRRVLIHIPGGGFVAMSPRHHADYLLFWASKMPNTLIVAPDYAKAPEYPFPYAIEECFELYREIVETDGKCLGIIPTNKIPPAKVYSFCSKGIMKERFFPIPGRPLSIILSGDSAGGAIATAVLIKAIEANIYIPAALLLIYPLLSCDFACWLSLSQRHLLHPNTARYIGTRANVGEYVRQALYSPRSNENLNSKESINQVTEEELPIIISTRRSSAIKEIASNTLKLISEFNQKRSIKMTVFDEFGLAETLEPSKNANNKENKNSQEFELNNSINDKEPIEQIMKNTGSLAMTSRIRFFNDRVLSQETMRALALLYLGHNQPNNFDVRKNYYVSPILAPEHILARMPMTYIICGDKDPLLDDSVIFGGRLRESKRKMGSQNLQDCDIARVAIIEGVSHGFLNLMKILPEGREAALLLQTWILEAFTRADDLNPIISPSLTPKNKVFVGLPSVSTIK